MANRLAVAVTAYACVHACLCLVVCVSEKQKIYYFHIVGLRSKGLYKSFVLFYPLIVQLHPYGVSLWQKYGSHDSMSVGVSSQIHVWMLGCERPQSEICGDENVKTISAASKGDTFA